MKRYLVLLAPFGILAFVASESRPGESIVDEPVTRSEPMCVGRQDGCWAVYHFDLAKKVWSTWKSPPTDAPSFSAFTAVGSRRAVVLNPGSKYSGWLFELDGGKWTPIPESPIAGPDRCWDPIVVAFVDSKLVVWGLSKGPPHGAVLDIKTKQWTTMPESPIALRFRSRNAVIGNQVIVWGGYPALLQDGAVFDVGRHTWQKMPDSPVPYSTNMVWGVWRDRYFVFGGRNRRMLDRSARSGAIYDPASRTWQRMVDAPLDVGIMSACTVSGDRLFVWSGQAAPRELAGKGASTPEGAVYHFKKQEWKAIPESPLSPRPLAFAFPVGNKIVVWGGWRSGGPAELLRDGAVYDLDRAAWERIPDFPGEVPYQLHPGW